MYCSTLTSCCTTILVLSSAHGPPAATTHWARSLPGARSMTMPTRVASSTTPCSLTMFGWCACSCCRIAVSVATSRRSSPAAWGEQSANPTLLTTRWRSGSKRTMLWAP